VGTVHLSTSVRAEALHVTARRARQLARRLGITRVTDITRLDSVGIPVFASIRPDAAPGSLCVNAGKGLRFAEARVGALMEAIEFAFAEYNRSGLEVYQVPAGLVYEGGSRPDAILDFCPRMGLEIPLEQPITCVSAADIESGEVFAVPAELVFLPCPQELATPHCFGASSNGLASGNTILDATIHGLAEVIERDVQSFNWIDDRSVLVRLETLPIRLRAVRHAIERAGLTLYVRFVENAFALPFFNATIVDLNRVDPVYVNGGQGCHPDRDVAAARAICEALQSRLSFIHGGRDDLTDFYGRYETWSADDRRAQARRIIETAARTEPSIAFDEIPTCSSGLALAATLRGLITAVHRAHVTRILRVVYTPKRLPLQVVRVIVPGLEFFSMTSVRVGKRLRDHVRSIV